MSFLSLDIPPATTDLKEGRKYRERAFLTVTPDSDLSYELVF
jgi:hypothetical protein